jgi:A/G-specific adenine glycosylase
LPPPFRRITASVESWFARNQRPLPWRATYDPWLVWLSEVMLQQTRMEVVLRYYSEFVRRFPTLISVAEASEDAVLAAWSGLGYYRRARMLREGAADVVARFEGSVPQTVAELTVIPGIGRYTAGAISSIAHEQKAPIVDGNVARILSRIFAIEAAAGSPKLMRAAWVRSEQLVAACRSPRAFNQGLMEIGALLCKPRKPECPRCPVRRFCAAYASGRVEELPLKKETKSPRAMTIPLYIVHDGRGRVLMRRDSGSLMTLPTGDTLSIAKAELLGSFRHTITTRRIVFRVYAAELAQRIREGRDEYAWIDPGNLATVPHPSYVRKALECGSKLPHSRLE